MTGVHQFFKASAVGDRETESATLVFHEPVPQLGGEHWQEEGMKLYGGEAARLEELLYATLPGGTYDALLRALLLRRASHFRPTFPPVESRRSEGRRSTDRE